MVGSQLPRVSGQEVIAALAEIGWVVARKEGSHRLLKGPEGIGRTTVPDHKELKTGTLRRILRDVDISVTTFNELRKG